MKAADDVASWWGDGEAVVMSEDELTPELSVWLDSQIAVRGSG